MALTGYLSYCKSTRRNVMASSSPPIQNGSKPNFPYLGLRISRRGSHIFIGEWKRYQETPKAWMDPHASYRKYWNSPCGLVKFQREFLQHSVK